MAIGKNSLVRAAGAARDQKVNSPSAAIVRSQHPMLDLVSVRDVKHLPDDPKAAVAPTEALVQSVKENGIVEPLFLAGLPDRELYLVSGHQRLAAAREAGLESVPAVIQPVPDIEAALRLTVFVAPFAMGSAAEEPAAEEVSAPEVSAPAEVPAPVAKPAPVEEKLAPVQPAPEVAAKTEEKPAEKPAEKTDDKPTVQSAVTEAPVAAPVVPEEVPAPAPVRRPVIVSSICSSLPDHLL